ncbi:hypothetical protein ATCC90586_002578 [Pythium insidiosum]|nr:hypothetical protein ATCC90586_002578 [Pythium insidiosum]
MSKVVDEIGRSDPKQRHELIKSVAEKSLRCAELIEQVLEVADKFKHIDDKLAEAEREADAGKPIALGDDDDVDMDDQADAQDAALLLKDLVTASKDLQDSGKSLAHVGIVNKTAHSSRELLSSSERQLKKALASLSADGAQAAQLNDEFRDLYAEEFTAAFGDDLDAFRQEERFESRDVAYLISCIHAGSDVFTPLQKKLFVESSKRSSQ